MAICLIEPDNDFRQRKRPIKANLQDPFVVCALLTMSRTEKNEIDNAADRGTRRRCDRMKVERMRLDVNCRKFMEENTFV